MYHRRASILLLLFLQLCILLLGIIVLTQYMPYLYLINLVLAFGLTIYTINRDNINPSFRIGWLVLMCLFPILGGALYLFIHLNPRPKAIASRMREAIRDTRPWMQQDPAVLAELEKENPIDYGMAYYLSTQGPFPIYRNNNVTYYDDGGDGFEALLANLQKAETYILMEYFIVSPGGLLDRLVAVLAERAAAGVEVRFLYDGYNHITKLDFGFPEEMEKLGIDARPFAPIHPFLSTEQNYRDHRKITVIDGRYAFTGGINLADEYINLVQPYGHWKDVVIRLEGDAVQSFISLFLQMWNTSSYDAPLPTPEHYYKGVTPVAADTDSELRCRFVAPYADTPNTGLNFGKAVYTDIINSARHYVYITSPYLILDDHMRDILAYAARRGVDVQLILPHIPDKRIPFMVARTYYDTLLKSGIRVYEYEPGFIHAKIFVSDDRVATIGTFNMDYRSFYLHYEVGTWLSDCSCVEEIKDDFADLCTQSFEITPTFWQNLPLRERMAGRFFRLFSPLM